MPWVVPDYRAPRWMAGAHTQTILAAKLCKKPKVVYRRERWDTPDNDFIDVDWATPEVADPSTPILVHFHGLEGSSHSHYALALMHETVARGWRGCVAHFRSCSGELNRLARTYHAGDIDDLEWVLRTVRSRYPQAVLYAVGVSLGGNQVALFCGKRSEAAKELLTAAVSVGAPVDLVAGSNLLKQGFNRVYSEMFLNSLIPKVLKKMELHPELEKLIDREAIKKCVNFYDFDSLFTAPVHGFKNAMDYWTQCSAKPWLKNIQIPFLLLNARNDPFLPEWALPTLNDVSDMVWLDQPKEGGHIGFPTGNPPGRVDYLPERIFRFFLEKK